MASFQLPDATFLCKFTKFFDKIGKKEKVFCFYDGNFAKFL